MYPSKFLYSGLTYLYDVDTFWEKKVNRKSVGDDASQKTRCIGKPKQRRPTESVNTASRKPGR